MTEIVVTPGFGVSRRRMIQNLGLLGAAVGFSGAALATAATAGVVKLDQKSAAYQPKPKGKARCDGCKQWVAPAGCKVVEGVIAPTGWCVLYAATKPAHKK